LKFAFVHSNYFLGPSEVLLIKSLRYITFMMKLSIGDQF